MKRGSKKKLDEKWHRRSSEYLGQQCRRILNYELPLLLLRNSFISRKSDFWHHIFISSHSNHLKTQSIGCLHLSLFRSNIHDFCPIIAIYPAQNYYLLYFVWLADIHVWSEYSPCNFIRSKYWCFDIYTPCDRAYAYVHLCMIASMRN